MAGRAAVIFCRRHIGIPLEREPGEWVHSVASPHELPALLAHIYSVELGSEDLSTALPAPDKAGATNDDMMILVVDDHPINRRLLADSSWDRWDISVKRRMTVWMRSTYSAKTISISC